MDASSWNREMEGVRKSIADLEAELEKVDADLLTAEPEAKAELKERDYLRKCRDEAAEDQRLLLKAFTGAAAAPEANIPAGEISDLSQQLQRLKVAIDHQNDKLAAFIANNSSVTVDASKVTPDDIDQMDQALNATRWPKTTVSFETMKADKIQYVGLTRTEDSQQQMLEVEAFLNKHALADGLDVPFCILNVNHASPTNFPKAIFSGISRHYRGKADYLIANSKYSGLKDAVLQRRVALVGFELKKDLSTQEEANYMAQARLGFYSYGALSNAALLYVLTDLVKGGVLFWAKYEGQELQVFERAVSGMKELFMLVRDALKAVPMVSMEEADITNRDRFRILGYQHPCKMPGELLMKLKTRRIAVMSRTSAPGTQVKVSTTQWCTRMRSKINHMHM